MTGIYRFSAGGWLPTGNNPSTPDVRIAMLLSVNDAITALSGGQLSVMDTPVPALSFAAPMNAGDKAALKFLCPLPVTLGGLYPFFFQGELLK